MIHAFGAFNGGFMLKWFWMPEALGHTPTAIKAMAQTVIKEGHYPLMPDQQERNQTHGIG